MNCRNFKNALAFVTLIAVLTFSNTVLAQGRGDKMTPAPDYSKMSREEVNKDVTSRMEKFEEIYNKLKQKEAQTKNEQLKADLNRMTTKMEEIRTEMSKAEPDRAKVRKTMEELRAMREEMKSKYGEQRAARKQKAESRQKGQMK